MLPNHVEYSDQQMDAGQSILSNKDIKFMKTCTIIFIGTMILALRVLAMFTLSMGTLTLESTIFIANKDDFDQQMACEAPVCWLKYTTHFYIYYSLFETMNNIF